MTTRIPWNTITNTGDQSEYVFVIATAIQTNVPVIKRTLTASKYFRLVCDRLAEWVLEIWGSSISSEEPRVSNLFPSLSYLQIDVCQILYLHLPLPCHQ